MSDIKLTCLIRENLPEDAFEIEIGMFDSVYYLKEIIIKKIPKEFTDSKFIGLKDFVTYPIFLKLWKVNISINEKKKFEQLKNHTLSIKKILGGEEIINKDIDHYFSNDMLHCKDFIHIIVELPIGIDKNLGKSWNALKNGKIINVKMSKDHPNYKLLSLSKDASYLLGNDKEEQQYLLIRDCYHHLADTFLKEKKKRLHIVGNPGIGLTYFSYYLLYQLAQQNKTVIYDSKDNECVIVFSKNYTLYCNNDEYYLRNLDILDHYYYVVDDTTPSLMLCNFKMVLISSPHRPHYKLYEKEYGPHRLYMSVWSWEEINICRHVNFHHLSQEKVWELYMKWGGIPLFTLNYALNKSKQKLFQRAIDIVDSNLLRYFGERYYEKDIRYMLVHILTNEKGDSILQFASAYVSEKIVDKLEIYYKDELINFISYPSYSEYHCIHNAIFEYIAHRTLSNGGSFEIQPLFKSMDNSKLTMSKREKQIFSDIDDIEPDKYCIPSKKNFICDINAIVSPNMFFIMSVSKDYINNMKDLDLEKLIDKFIDKSDESVIELYFVMPKFENVIIKKNKNLPSLNDRLRQYILELDISLICGGNKDTIGNY